MNDQDCGVDGAVTAGRPAQNIDELAASPATILFLVRQARQGRPPCHSSLVPWGDRLAAMKMLQRGIPIPDVLNTFGVTDREMDKWIEEAHAKRPFTDFEEYIRMWALMLDQKSPEEKEFAEGSCSAIVSRASRDLSPALWTLGLALANFSLVEVLLHDPAARDSYFDPPIPGTRASIQPSLSAVMTFAAE